jgi:hypothetical protein
VIFKSDSHLSQDGPEIPNIEVWRGSVVKIIGARCCNRKGMPRLAAAGAPKCAPSGLWLPATGFGRTILHCVETLARRSVASCPEAAR